MSRTAIISVDGHVNFITDDNILGRIAKSEL